MKNGYIWLAALMAVLVAGCGAAEADHPAPESINGQIITYADCVDGAWGAYLDTNFRAAMHNHSMAIMARCRYAEPWQSLGHQLNGPEHRRCVDEYDAWFRGNYRPRYEPARVFAETVCATVDREKMGY